MNKKRFFEKFSEGDTDEGSVNKPGIIMDCLKVSIGLPWAVLYSHPPLVTVFVLNL